jgi:hypothetical protein
MKGEALKQISKADLYRSVLYDLIVLNTHQYNIIFNFYANHIIICNNIIYCFFFCFIISRSKFAFPPYLE